MFIRGLGGGGGAIRRELEDACRAELDKTRRDAGFGVGGGVGGGEEFGLASAGKGEDYEDCAGGGKVGEVGLGGEGGVKFEF